LVLENLATLAWAGAVVLPPIPAFYVRGDESLSSFLEAYAQRVLDHLGLGAPGPGHRWA
jgi:3-polyprenyl-4-hydroxybenzoate decarboxylase